MVWFRSAARWQMVQSEWRGRQHLERLKRLFDLQSLCARPFQRAVRGLNLKQHPIARGSRQLLLRAHISYPHHLSTAVTPTATCALDSCVR
jgi:hypothetical protein